MSNIDEHTYDSNGNLIHSKWTNGFERWREFDSNGKLVHVKYSNGEEEWYERDSNGLLVSEKRINGRVILHQYGTDGILRYIGQKSPDNYEYRNYVNGKFSYRKFPDGREEWYDSYGHLIDKPQP